MNEMLIELLYQYLLPIPAILIAMTVHEVCHGFVAEKCGDPTPRAMGRLSFNPLRHIHPLGFLSLMLIGFGAAQPVQVNARNFKKPRRDMAFVALAGPLSNLILAFFGALLLVLYAKFAYPLLSGSSDFSYGLSQALLYLLQYFCLINLGFFAFNLIPLPPLDGSHILFALLPARFEWKIRRYERTFSYILLGLIVLSILADRLPGLWFLDILSIVLGSVRSFFYNLFIDFWSLIFGGVL